MDTRVSRTRDRSSVRACAAPLYPCGAAGESPAAAGVAAGSDRVVYALTGLAAAVTVTAGLLVLAGWAFDVAWLRAPLPATIDMKANTALGFLLGGVALVGLGAGSPARSRHVVSACGVGVAALGAATLAEYLLGRGFGIDEMLFADHDLRGGTVHPGRLAPQTALCFLLCGTAMVLARRGWTAMRTAELLAVGAALIAILTSTAYAYGVPRLTSYPGFTPMAPHTAMVLLVLSLGLVAAVWGPIARSVAGRGPAA